MTRLPVEGLRRLCVGTVISTAALTLLGACKEEQPVAEAPAPVRVEQVALASTTEARAYTGVVRARYETDLGFRVAGKIVERLVNIGDRVEKDQVLVRLDPTDYRLAVEATEADLAAAKSSFAQAAAEEGRFSKLVAQGWVSAASYDQRKAASDEARGPSAPWAPPATKWPIWSCARTRLASSRRCRWRWGRWWRSASWSRA